jgi:hypothetical protein
MLANEEARQPRSRRTAVIFMAAALAVVWMSYSVFTHIQYQWDARRAFERIALGGLASDAEQAVGRAPACRFRLEDHEILYFVPQNKATWPQDVGCSAEPRTVSKPSELPWPPYVTVLIVVSSSARIEGRMLSGETGLELLSGHSLVDLKRWTRGAS